MATKLEGDSKIKRVVRVYGVGDIEVTLSADGFAFRAPGTKIHTTLPLGAAVTASQTPANVASYHFGKPMEFLKAQVEKVAKSKAERENA
jgi:hypothetical protein